MQLPAAAVTFIVICLFTLILKAFRGILLIGFMIYKKYINSVDTQYTSIDILLPLLLFRRTI